MTNGKPRASATRSARSNARAAELLFALLLLSACQRGQPATPRPAYSPGPDGLRTLWLEVVTAAQRDDRQRVSDLMASMTLTDGDLAAMFGAARARPLAPRYRWLMDKLLRQGAPELIAQVYEHKYDDVEVFATGGDPVDRAVRAALPPALSVYGVRVKRKGEKLGLRYDFFVFLGGRWTTGNQLGQYLLPDAGVL